MNDITHYDDQTLDRAREAIAVGLMDAVAADDKPVLADEIINALLNAGLLIRERE